ncbi:MAG: hypothetical protein KF901_07380 [Myxococcales bacterium]|nr:hypothetical protein [Myxococcales bacterium]
MLGHAAAAKDSGAAARAAIALGLIIALSYCGAYMWARATHRLVHYRGACTGCDLVRSPESYWGCAGTTPIDFMFAPLAWAEGKLHAFPFGL